MMTLRVSQVDRKMKYSSGEINNNRLSVNCKKSKIIIESITRNATALSERRRVLHGFVLCTFIKPVIFVHCVLMSLHCVIEPVTFACCMLTPFYISHTRNQKDGGTIYMDI